jgi:hypothetical protein
MKFPSTAQSVPETIATASKPGQNVEVVFDQERDADASRGQTDAFATSAKCRDSNPEPADDELRKLAAPLSQCGFET